MPNTRFATRAAPASAAWRRGPARALAVLIAAVAFSTPGGAVPSLETTRITLLR